MQTPRGVYAAAGVVIFDPAYFRRHKNVARAFDQRGQGLERDKASTRNNSQQCGQHC